MFLAQYPRLIANLSLVLAIILPFLLIHPQYFPFTGFCLGGIFLALFIFLTSSKHNLQTYIWLTLSIIFSLCFFFRSNPTLTFFNFTALIYSLTIFVRNEEYKEKKLNFWAFLVDPFVLPFVIFAKKNLYPLNWNWKSIQLQNMDKKGMKNTLIQVTIGLLVSIGILILILPLLASSNPFFAKYIESFLDIFNPFSWIINLIENLFSLTGILRILLLAFFFFLLPKTASLLQAPEAAEKLKTESEKGEIKIDSLIFLVPKIVLIFVLAVFFVSQLELYLASEEQLKQLGYNYGNLNNEVFGQLSVVCLVLFGLIYFDKHRKVASLATSAILILQGVFLASIASKSVFDYIFTWGLTFKRLYGLAVVAVVFGLFALLIYKLISKMQDQIFLRAAAMLVLLILVCVNVANFDSLIYNSNPPRETKGLAYDYYSQLSPDVGNLDNVFDKVLQQYRNNRQNQSLEEESRRTLNRLLNQIEYLQNKYKDLDIRTLNLAEYQAYQSIKNVDTRAIDREVWERQNPIFRDARDGI